MNAASDLRVREICGQQLFHTEAILRRQPAEPARSHTSNPPSYAVVVPEFLLFSLKKCDEGFPDIPKADDTEVVSPDAGVSRLKWLYFHCKRHSASAVSSS